MEAMYTAKATAIGGRNGHVRSENGALDADIKPPKELGGTAGDYLNPEILFAAGYAACFDSALNHVARVEKIKLNVSMVTAEVGIGKLENGGFGLTVTLDITVRGVDLKTAEELVHNAHQACPYSNAIRNNVDVTLNVTTAK